MQRTTVVGILGATALAWTIGCSRSGPTEVPSSGDEACNAADDCNDMFRGGTVRSHSDQAAAFAELSTGCPYAPEDVPDLATLDDRTVPQFNAARTRKSNMHRGEERLQEIDLHEHMMGMQTQIFACVDLAACYSDGAELPGEGDLDFDFELRPDGHVAAVSVQASPGLDHPSVVACARRAMYEYRFPSYDGGQMMIEYSMNIQTAPE